MGAALALLVVSSLVMAPSATATSNPVTHDSTLTVSIPGGFSGCYYYASDTSPALRALLDLIRPSAFENKPNGDLTGAPGPIVQAELVSLSPQTVVYTLDTTYTWSNGAPFNGLDLEHWYQISKGQATSLADGYRSIGSLVVSPTLNQVTVTFAQPYADWPTLFRDINERSVAASCDLGSLVSQPSLGPYELTAITPDAAYLKVDPNWLGQAPGYEGITVRTSMAASAIANSAIVDYRYAMDPRQLMRITNDGILNGEIGWSSGLLSVAFSPERTLTQQLAVRQYLSLSIDRQYVDDQVLGPTTYTSGIASSALLPQGIAKYPGEEGLGPIDQSASTMATTMPNEVGVDCVTCAAPILRAAGYSHASGRWLSTSGEPLAVTLGYGGADYDYQTATCVANVWRAEGVSVELVGFSSDLALAHALATGRVDTGIMTVDTALVSGLTARAWTGVDYGDTYDIGWRSALVDQWFAAGTATFNPVDAQNSYDSIDQYITTQAWERPLFTQPSILTWSNDVYGVVTSDYLQGMIDQVPAWGYTTPIRK